MKVLVTGSEGIIGTVVKQVLQDDGHEVVGFDIANGQDICKPHHCYGTTPYSVF